MGIAEPTDFHSPGEPNASETTLYKLTLSSSHSMRCKLPDAACRRTGKSNVFDSIGMCTGCSDTGLFGQRS